MTDRTPIEMIPDQGESARAVLESVRECLLSRGMEEPMVCYIVTAASKTMHVQIMVTPQEVEANRGKELSLAEAKVEAAFSARAK